MSQQLSITVISVEWQFVHFCEYIGNLFMAATDSNYEIKYHKVTVFTDRHSAACSNAIRIIKDKGWLYNEIDIETNHNIAEKLKSVTGKDSVPQIFFGSNFIGGCDELESLENLNSVKEMSFLNLETLPKDREKVVTNVEQFLEFCISNSQPSVDVVNEDLSLELPTIYILAGDQSIALDKILELILREMSTFSVKRDKKLIRRKKARFMRDMFIQWLSKNFCENNDETAEIVCTKLEDLKMLKLLNMRRRNDASEPVKNECTWNFDVNSGILNCAVSWDKAMEMASKGEINIIPEWLVLRYTKHNRSDDKRQDKRKVNNDTCEIDVKKENEENKNDQKIVEEQNILCDDEVKPDEDENNNDNKDKAEDKFSVPLIRRLYSYLLNMKESLRTDGGYAYDHFVFHPQSFKFRIAVCQLQNVNLFLMSKESRKAFLINAYNMLNLHGNLELGIPYCRTSRKRFMDDVKYFIGEFFFSLNDIRNGLLRCDRCSSLGNICRFGFSFMNVIQTIIPKKIDRRINFVLSDGAKSCPSVKLYSDTNLEAEIQSSALEYCAKDENVHIDSRERLVLVSQMFKWYSYDFGIKPSCYFFCILANWLTGQKLEVLRNLAKLEIKHNGRHKRSKDVVRKSKNTNLCFRKYVWTTDAVSHRVYHIHKPIYWAEV